MNSSVEQCLRCGWAGGAAVCSLRFAVEVWVSFFFFSNDPATPELYPLPLHAPLPTPEHPERAGEPLAAANALVQPRPGDEHRPERHREDEHRGASRPATCERHRRRSEVDRRLEK